MYQCGVIEKESGRDKKPSLQDVAALMSLYRWNTSKLVCEMKRLFRAESQWIHFQALLESPYLRAPWHITTTYLEDRASSLLID